jgi:hypothetical protein
MSITHEEAQKLIQFKADDALMGFDNHLLEDHLRNCLECQKYAASIQALESTLPLLLHRRWDQQPLPHSTGQAFSRKPIRLQQNIFFATRIIAMGVICVAFLFNVWHFAQSGRTSVNPPSAVIPVIPTPSVQSTTTKPLDQKCERIVYVVQQGDTLERIAKQFSVSADEVMKANQLRSNALPSSMALSIPVCSLTPSGTPDTAASTFTPFLGTTTLTPIDSPTQ